MSDLEAEKLQNSRIRDLENRVNQVENDMAAILSQLQTMTQLGKAGIMLIGIALGVDVVPLLGGM